MPNNQAHDPRVSTAPERVAAPVGLTVAAVASGGALAGFTPQSGFTATDNGDGTITVSDAQSRFGVKPNAAKPVWFFDFGSGSDQPHPTLSRQQKVISWSSACALTTSVAKTNASHSMTIDAEQADSGGPVFTTGDATLDLPANTGRKNFRYYDVYNDFTYSELVASAQANTPASSENLKHHRWQPPNGQATHYLACTMQASNYRFDFAGDGLSIYDSQLYDADIELAAKSWNVEEEYHVISSATGATDAAMYGCLNGESRFARVNVDSHNGTDPTLPENQWDHYKLANFLYWAVPGVAPWRANILYVDDSWCRIYITDKPTWNPAEQKAMEIQVPTAWAAPEITFHKRDGQFSSLIGKYLWTVDNDDNKILVGGWS